MHPIVGKRLIPRFSTRHTGSQPPSRSPWRWCQTGCRPARSGCPPAPLGAGATCWALVCRSVGRLVPVGPPGQAVPARRVLVRRRVQFGDGVRVPRVTVQRCPGHAMAGGRWSRTNVAPGGHAVGATGATSHTGGGGRPAIPWVGWPGRGGRLAVACGPHTWGQGCAGRGAGGGRSSVHSCSSTLLTPLPPTPLAPDLLKTLTIPSTGVTFSASLHLAHITTILTISWAIFLPIKIRNGWEEVG